MAGKRIYITIPKRDYELILHLGLDSQECPGMTCRRWVLTALYNALGYDKELQEYDQYLATEERAEILRHGR